MAFTTPQLALFRSYLGLPSVWQFQDPVLEGVMTSVGNDPDASALALSYAANVTTVLNDIQSTALPLAGFQSADKGDAVLGANNAQTEGKKEIGRMWVGMLSSLFGVEVRGDIFGGRGYQGHGWARNQRSSLAGMG
ncbi:MAG: hypothetical protein JWN36_2397 [Microbacteriaceae bacterium]|nr:hypothetical protein [Microbacteriaceae bacterium]